MPQSLDTGALPIHLEVKALQVVLCPRQRTMGLEECLMAEALVGGRVERRQHGQKGTDVRSPRSPTRSRTSWPAAKEVYVGERSGPYSVSTTLSVRGGGGCISKVEFNGKHDTIMAISMFKSRIAVDTKKK